jgi:hypothetical protein
MTQPAVGSSGWLLGAPRRAATRSRSASGLLLRRPAKRGVGATIKMSQPATTQQRSRTDSRKGLARAMGSADFPELRSRTRLCSARAMVGPHKFAHVRIQTDGLLPFPHANGIRRHCNAGRLAAINKHPAIHEHLRGIDVVRAGSLVKKAGEKCQGGMNFGGLAHACEHNMPVHATNVACLPPNK